MFNDVRREFLEPLSLAHRQRGGVAITSKQEEAACAMLVAKILWDVGLGNTELAAFIHMLGARFGTGAEVD
jgi:hypothetical protein